MLLLNNNNYYLSARYDQITNPHNKMMKKHHTQQQHFSLSLSPNVQDEAFWYIDKSCEDRQENLRLMTASRRRLQAVQDARDAAAAPPSRCAVFAARAIRDFARAFFRTSQDVFDDGFYLANQNQNSQQQFQFSSSKIAQKFMMTAMRANRNNNMNSESSLQKNQQQASFLTISLICQELSNLFFMGRGSLQHASLSLLPILACIRQTGDQEERRGNNNDGEENDQQQRPSSALLLSGFDPSLQMTGNIINQRSPTRNNNNNNNTINRRNNNTIITKQPLKKESILVSTLRSQRMLNQS